jgi:hypothetical protein
MPLSAWAGRFFRPDVPAAKFRIRVAARLLKPRMLIGRVVDDKIDEHADAALLGAVSEFDEIAERSKSRIDIVVIGDVVAVVLARRFLERHQPDPRDAETMQIVEAPHEALEITYAIGVRVHVSGGRQAVDD